MTDNTTPKGRQRQRGLLEPAPSTDSENDARATQPRRLERRDGTVSTSWGEANGSRPPFGVGNKVAVRHGVFSGNLVRERAAEVFAELAENVPFLSDLDEAEVASYVALQARFQMLEDWLAEIAEKRGLDALYGPKPYVRASVLELYVKLAAQAQKAAESLGFTPSGRHKLLKDAAVGQRLAADSVRDVAARGRQLRGGESA